MDKCKAPGFTGITARDLQYWHMDEHANTPTASAVEK